jgi:transposase
MARSVLRQIIGGEYTNENVRKIIGKISNGFEYWFTFVLHPGLSQLTTKLKGLFVDMLSRERLLGLCATKKGR